MTDEDIEILDKVAKTKGFETWQGLTYMSSDPFIWNCTVKAMQIARLEGIKEGLILMDKHLDTAASAECWRWHTIEIQQQINKLFEND